MRFRGQISHDLTPHVRESGARLLLKKHTHLISQLTVKFFDHFSLTGQLSVSMHALQTYKLFVSQGSLVWIFLHVRSGGTRYQNGGRKTSCVFNVLRSENLLQIMVNS